MNELEERKVVPHRKSYTEVLGESVTELEESLSELELLENSVLGEAVTLLVHGEGTVVDHEQFEVRLVRLGCGVDSQVVSSQGYSHF